MWHRAVLGAVVLLIIRSAAVAAPTVLTFDDIVPQGEVYLTNSGYGGLTWELGNTGYGGNVGFWGVPSTDDPYSHPHSPPRDVVNGWGCSQIGISFPGVVDMGGAYIAGQGNGPFTSALRVHGYRNGLEVSDTDWFRSITTTPAWFDMSALANVDRIVFESVVVYQNTGVYGLDDLTFTYIPEPAGLAALSFAAAALLARRRRKTQGVTG